MLTATTPRVAPASRPEPFLELWQRTRAGDRSARDELMLAVLPLLRRIAHHVARKVTCDLVEPDDLVQEAVLELPAIFARWSPAGGATFQSYVMTRVRGAMRDALRRADPLSRKMREAAKSVTTAREALTGELARRPTALEVADRLKITSDELDERAQTGLHAGAAWSLSQAVNAAQDGAGEFTTLGDTTPTPGPGVLEKVALVEEFERALHAIPAGRERTTIEMRFYVGLRQSDVARALGLSESRVHQLEHRAIAAARARLGAA